MFWLLVLGSASKKRFRREVLPLAQNDTTCSELQQEPTAEHSAQHLLPATHPIPTSCVRGTHSTAPSCRVTVRTTELSPPEELCDGCDSGVTASQPPRAAGLPVFLHPALALWLYDPAQPLSTAWCRPVGLSAAWGPVPADTRL